MENPQQAPSALETAPEKQTSEPTTTAVGGAEVQMVHVPEAIYETAQEENRQHNFAAAITEARRPPPEVIHEPPPVPKQLLKQTNAEQEAGRKLVKKNEAAEAERKLIVEAHKNDKWADKKSEAIFRPADHIPDPKKPAPAQKGVVANV